MDLDIGAMRQFVETLRGEDNPAMAWRLIDDQGGKWAKTLRGTVEEVADALHHGQGKGAGIFLCVNRVGPDGVKAADVTGIESLFVDCDAGLVQGEFAIPPNMRVATGRGEHLYWLVEAGQPLNDFGPLQRQLAARLGTDAAVCDLPRVMRVPGTWWLKEQPRLVEAAYLHEDRTTFVKVRDLIVNGFQLRRYADAIPGTAEGQRNSAAYRTSCKLLDRTEQEDQAFDALRRWNDRNRPPISDAELNRVFKSALKHRQEAKGSKIERALAKADAEEAKTLGPVKKGYVALALEIMAAHPVVKDYAGQVYLYDGAAWRAGSGGNVASLALHYDVDSNRSNVNTSGRSREIVHQILCRSHVGKPIKWNQLGEADVAFRNGVLDVETGELRPHQAEDYLDRVVEHDYNPDAKVPALWDRCLDMWFGGDVERRCALQEFFGYVLASHARYKRALVLYGPGNTGKSVVVKLINDMVGNRNSCQISVRDMGSARAIAPIVGKMVNLITELPANAMIADGGFKQLVSTGEPVAIDQKYALPFLYTPTCKHVVATNILPRVEDATEATHNRLLVINMDDPVAEKDQDPALGAALQQNVGGVVAWALRGLERLQRNGGRFTIPGAMTEIIADHRLDDPILGFIDENYCRVEGAVVDMREFIRDFNQWHGGPEWNKTKIGRALRAAGFPRNSRKQRTGLQRK